MSNMNPYQNPMGDLGQHTLFANQSPAIVGDIYGVVYSVMSQFNIPNTEQVMNVVNSQIMPYVNEHFNQANLSVAKMTKFVEDLFNQNRAQMMELGKLRQNRNSAIRLFTIDETGCGICIEDKKHTEVGHIRIQDMKNVRIQKDGTYKDYKYITYLDSQQESRKTLIPLDKLAGKNLITKFEGFSFICSNKSIANAFLAWYINVTSTNESVDIPEYPGFIFTKVNDVERAAFTCNNGEMDMELLDACSDTFKKKILTDESIQPDEISAFAAKYLNTPEKFILFAYSICGALSNVLTRLKTPISQILALDAPDSDIIRQACYYLQLYNREKNVITFDSNKATIRRTFHEANDETVIIKDCSIIDNDKRRMDVLNYVLELNSDAESSPHNTVIISPFAQYMIPSSDSICLTLDSDFYTKMSKEEELTMCCDLSRLTRYLLETVAYDINKWQDELKSNIDKLIQDERGTSLPYAQSTTSYAVIVSVSLMICKILQFSAKVSDISDMMLPMFATDDETPEDTNSIIVDEFVHVLNASIRNNNLDILINGKDMDFIEGKCQVIVKEDLLLFEESTLTEALLPAMKTTNSLHHLLSALDEDGILYATKKDRYPSTVYHNGETTRITFIAVTSDDILDQDVQHKIRARMCSEWFAEKPLDTSFIPIVTNSLNYTAYQKYDFKKAENLHYFVSGESGSGKTHHLTERLVNLQKQGQKVVVFDTSTSFTESEILEKLTAGGDDTVKEQVKAYMEQHITFHNVETDGLPVDLLKLEDPDQVNTSKNDIYNIITAHIQKLGRRQQADLRNSIDMLIKENRMTIKNFYDDMMEGKVSDSLASLFDDTLSPFNMYQPSDKSWGEFFNSTKDIVIISATEMTSDSGSALIDMLLMSLYHYQFKNPTNHLAIVIDEIQNQNYNNGSAIYRVLREGRKKHMSLNYATQYLSDANKECKQTMNGAGIKVYLRQDSITANSIARTINVKGTELTNLKQGECYVVGQLYNNTDSINRPGIVRGFTFRNFVKPKSK